MLADYINIEIIKKEAEKMKKSKSIYKLNMNHSELTLELIDFYTFIYHNTEMKLDSRYIPSARRGWILRADQQYKRMQ